MKHKIIGIFILVSSTLFVGCSSKMRPTKRDRKPEVAEKKEKTKDETVEKETARKRFTEANVSLLVPFNLNTINLSIASKADVERHAMPIDFYQGFNLGIDSAASSGLNFKLNVFDTEDNQAHIAKLLSNPLFLKNNLIIGPVFPRGLKAITPFSIAQQALVVSPLAASNPTDFNNPNLVTVANSLAQHATSIAQYISTHYNVANTIVVLINTKKTDDESFAAPIRAFFNSPENPRFNVQEFASTYAFERNMIKDKRYAVIVTSADRAFVLPTIDKLFKLKNNPKTKYNINLFGHPSWIKQNYPADQLENLQTVLTSSYKIDYKKSNVIKFIKTYRKKFGFEPGEYAFKGFDIGYYFGKLLAKYGADYREHIVKEKYTGLHNTFNFIFDSKTGFVNTHVILLRYHNFSLEEIN